MYNPIERAALISISRACGFAAFGIFLFMIGMGPFIVLSFKLGGVLTLALCLILLFKALQAPTRPYRRTEAWLILPKEQRPTPATAQRLIGGVLRSIYLTFAQYTAGLSCVLLLTSLLLAVMGVPNAG